MKSGTNSILINEADDVATALLDLHPGEFGKYAAGDSFVQVEIREEIPMYHKFAVRNLSKSDRVLKYGEVIGKATCDIPSGTHVHTHNLSSPGRQG
jgi:altronate dehydratase small subunit